MPLAPGTRLGPYEVTAQIGVGGMGEVYQATDTKLKRRVAIKVLPESVAADKDRLARFQREAEVLASLNHPHIAAIYGLETVGAPLVGALDEDHERPAPTASSIALVMELVEGEDLAERLRRGAIPVDEAIAIAKQIAEGLEEAHERGIIHRDLKPANIKLTAEGRVKILDFGLAKALEGDPTNSLANSQLRRAELAEASHSPTMSRHMTEAGMILGTAAYMSPEQARGKIVDKRADIWSFGVVLFEMLTGSRLFAGETVSDTLAAVLKEEAPWDRLPRDVPGHVTQMLKRCLVRTPQQRLRDIGDARLALDGAFETISPQVTASAAETLPQWRRWLPFATGAVVSALVVAVAAWSLWPKTEAPRITRTTIAQPAGQPLDLGINSPALALSPDGTRAVYRVIVEGQPALVVRPLDSLETTVLYRGGSAFAPFFSPDGAWVGFHDNSDRMFKRVAVTGGPVLTIGPSGSLLTTGATWGEDDTIIFGTQSNGLSQIPAGGGAPKSLTTLDEAQKESNHEQPELLPGGKAVLFTIRHLGDTVDKAQIAVRHLGTGEQRVLVSGGSYPKYVTTGHLVYAFAGTLRAVPFDPETLKVTGNPVGVLEGVSTKASGAADVAVAKDGSLFYVAATNGGAPPRTLVWVDRQGREQAIPAAPVRTYTFPRLSPDGTKIAVEIRDQENDVWVWDFTRSTLTRLTFDVGFDSIPVWTPDGKRIAFSSGEGGTRSLLWRAADGTGSVERLSGGIPMSFSPDGTRLVLSESGDLAVLNMGGDRQTTVLVKTMSFEVNAEVSPDGRWLAYQSNESGKTEVYVRPFPKVDTGRWQVSTDSGSRPVWARSGKELFYRGSDGAVMRVGVEGGTPFRADTPTQLFKGPYYLGRGDAFRTYDVSPDGKRFLMIKEGNPDEVAAPPGLILVQNWFEELKRLVPTKR